LQGQSIAKLQPMKLAAMENLEKTSDPAPLSLVPGLEIPAMLSFMVHNRPSGEVQGLKDLQKTFEYRYGDGNYTPPVWVSYIAFRVMVGVSFIMFFFVLYGISWHLFMKKNIHRKMMFLMLLGISLPYIANSAGWILAEMGRQPWIVYGLMPTDKAISVGISSGSIILSIIAFTLIYGALAAITFILMRREVFRGCKNKKSTKKTAVVMV
jgi:cytochrome bd ubiquinol oxidase subunit I